MIYKISLSKQICPKTISDITSWRVKLIKDLLYLDINNLYPSREGFIELRPTENRIISYTFKIKDLEPATEKECQLLKF